MFELRQERHIPENRSLPHLAKNALNTVK